LYYWLSVLKKSKISKMRRVIASMNVTLDDFMSGTNGELDWHFPLWNEEMAAYAFEELNGADTIILGRITYQAMAAYWPRAAARDGCTRNDISFANLMNDRTKIVFSSTLKKAAWRNTKILRGDIAKEITALKQQRGGDMIIYGSGSIVTALIQAGLVDEYQVWIHPVVIGSGVPLFRDMRSRLDLKLLRTKRFASGVIILYYEPAYETKLMVDG
jgi:dihydrofolate reductase